MGRYLLGVVIQFLQGRSPAQFPIFNRTIECTRALYDFYMYAQYKSHGDATLSYIEDSLQYFHTFKHISLPGQAGQKGKAKANALSTELVKMRKVDEDRKTETRTPSKKRNKMNDWRDYISLMKDVANELDADFNFQKFHLISHWVEQIRRYGVCQQYSAKRREQAHKTNLTDSWNASNHNLNYLPQVITFQRRIICFDISCVNLEALTQHRHIRAASCKVLPSRADLAAHLGSQSNPNHQIMAPQNRHEG